MMKSVLEQTFEDFELLIVDDGPTDSTLEIAKALERSDHRIRVLTRVNGGIAAARNTAMTSARGRFCALLDSDDLWMPGYLEAQLPLFDQFRVDVVSGNALNLGGSLDGRPLHADVSTIRTITLKDMIEHEDAVCILSVFRREVYETIGRFDECLRRNEDYQYWIRAAHRGFRFLENPVPLGFYRRRPDSVSADELLMLSGIINVLTQARDLCQDRPAECAAVERQLMRFESERLLLMAKIDLTRRQYEAAARGFEARYRLSRTMTAGLLAGMSRSVPQLLRWGYRVRQALRATERVIRSVSV
jgi:glycosyltransferase involved in cell wall biosynthesis